MSEQDILDIINTLKALQIQQQQVIRRQQELTQQLDHILAGRRSETDNPHRDGSVTPNTFELVHPNHRQSASPVTSGRVSPAINTTSTTRSGTNIPIADRTARRRSFIVGDHVYITNRLTHSVTPGPLDRAAIVTRVRPRRVDFRTLSGHETWRSPGNLRHLTDQEVTSLNQLSQSES